MSELMLNVLDGNREMHGRTHGSLVDAVVASLSADPETIEELEAALVRFIEPINNTSPLAHCVSGTCRQPWDAGICVVDLGARFVVSCSSWSAHRLNGQIAYHDGETATDVRLTYHLSDEWRIEHILEGWEVRAARRRRERQANPPWDTREILYGKVAEFIVQQCLAVVDLGKSLDNPIADVHARWLLTPRDDLRDQTPRDILLAKLETIDLDVWDRSAQWSLLGTCPPGLPEEASAYRFGGFGTHENVLYYDMLRLLIGACWKRLRQHPECSPTAEIRRLERLQESWLNEPQRELHNFSPAETIQSERQRIPVVVPRDDLMLDDDCPLCRMMAESAGPTFWHLDGCNMDEDFAFSFYRTQEEWESERRDADRLLEDSVAQSLGQSLGEPADEFPAAHGAESTWQHSYSCADALADLPAAAVVPTLLFRLGAHLAELGVTVKSVPASADFASQLNQDFSNLRRAVESRQEEQIGAIVMRFRETLASAAAVRPDLISKCADLESQLLKLQEELGVL